MNEKNAEAVQNVIDIISDLYEAMQPLVETPIHIVVFQEDGQPILFKDSTELL